MNEKFRRLINESVENLENAIDEIEGELDGNELYWELRNIVDKLERINE